LMRDLGARGVDILPVTVAEDGEVAVDGEPIGKLEGFRFSVDPAARLADKKRLLAAAERRLGSELTRRAKALAADSDSGFTLATDPGRPVAIFWKGDVVARLSRGKNILTPRLVLHRTLEPLALPLRQAIEVRLNAWLDTMIKRHLAPLTKLADAASDPGTSPALRAFYAPLGQALGQLPRRPLEDVLHGLDRDARSAAFRMGIRIGSLDVFIPALFKLEPLRWRMALAAVHRDKPIAALPPIGAVTVMRPDDAETSEAWFTAGYRGVDRQMIRADMAERIGRALHEMRMKAAAAHIPFVPETAMAISFGLHPASFARLLGDLGFRQQGEGWSWRSPTAKRAKGKQAPAMPGNAFDILATLRRRDG
jgi:ATP-dependent RNA helicase SUPV3L1/SUV3